MGTLMIRCPNTGRAVLTRYEVDPDRFSKLPVFFGYSYCSFCGTKHEWFAGDAWVSAQHQHSENTRQRRVEYRQAMNDLPSK